MELLDFEGPSSVVETQHRKNWGNFTKEWTGVFGEWMKVHIIDAPPNQIECALL
jgi:hypothetical protein